MKKAIKPLFPLLLVILTVSSAIATDKMNKPEIKKVDKYIAVFDFEVTTGDKGISRPLADSVIHEFSRSDKYEVIDRGNMNKILKEQKFQMSGCVAQECKVEAGQILGVGKIVNGSVGLVGKTYYLTLQLINVLTGKVELSAEDKCKCEVDELLDSTKRLAKKLLSEQVEQPVTTESKPITMVESKAEAIAKAKAEEIEKAKAKAEAEEIVKTKADAIAKAKVEAEEIAKTKAKAEEIERTKAEQIAKAEEIKRAKTEANELARQKAALEQEKQEIARDRQEIERQKALNAEIEQLVAERRKVEAERQQLAMAKRPSQPTTEETAPDGRFIAYNNGTVLDTRTNLMWAAKDNGSNISWGNAKSYCKNYRGGGYSDWRMPTQEELAGLYDKGKTYKSECSGVFGGTYDVHLTELIRLTCTWAWASETRGLDAAFFDFGDGHRGWVREFIFSFSRALPVRSGK